MGAVLRVDVLKNLLWRDIYQQRKGAFIFFGVLTAILFVFSLITYFDKGNYAGLYITWYGILIYLFGFFHTAGVYREFSMPATLQDYLLLPASHLEKWLSRWIRSLPIFIITFTVAFFLATLFFKVVAYIGFRETVPLFNPFQAEIYQFWKWYLLTHAIALIGAVHFNKYPGFKLILVIFVIWLGMTTITGIAQYMIFRGGGINFDELAWQGLYDWYLRHKTLISLSWHGVLFLILTPFLYYISYLKLTEKEV